MLEGAKRIQELFDNDRFEVFIVHGKNGVGKSTYCCTLLAEAYRSLNNGNPNWNIDLFKTHMGYHPKRVMDIWRKQKERDLAFVWDDAGVWLYNLDHQNAWVKSIGKFLQVARTKYGCIIFNCIGKQDIINKIRNFESCVFIEIQFKGEHASPYPSHKYRTMAYGYHTWESRNGKQHGIENDWEDSFLARMPDDFYKWYRVQREKYTSLQMRLMYSKMREQRDIMRFRDTKDL